MNFFLSIKEFMAAFNVTVVDPHLLAEIISSTIAIGGTGTFPF